MLIIRHRHIGTSSRDQKWVNHDVWHRNGGYRNGGYRNVGLECNAVGGVSNGS